MTPPRIAVLTADTLSALGLTAIVRSMMPHAAPAIFTRFEDLVEADDGAFFHYFVSAVHLLPHAGWFLQRQRRVIVLLHGDEAALLPDGFHTLNVCQDEEHLVRDFLRLSRSAHGSHGCEPEAVRRAGAMGSRSSLTPREREVVCGVVSGLRNKEIAARLGVTEATVISHRKNIAAKLSTSSVSSWTIYAVSRDWIKIEQI